ncbi:MAG: hypothetical protein WC813_00995 [Patescibacteria group bacterium]|jgi:photosystem II stability/assembly factor-like uncharacterized protein
MKKLLMVAGLSIVLLGAGCAGSKAPASGAGGVYGTTDGGRSWIAMNSLPLPTGVSSISGADITSLTRDPSNANVVYAGTLANGLLMSFDAGKSWQRPPEDKAFEAVKTGAVLDIEIDSQRPCVWYILKSDRLMKTDTCGRSYAQIYQEGRANQKLTALALDWYNPSIVWLGSTAGDVYKSADAGATWASATKLKDDISAIEVSRSDSRVVLVASLRRGASRSTDSGATWVDQEKDLKSFAKASNIHGFAETTDGKTLVMNTDYGIFTSADAGATWTPLTLVTAHGEVKITAVGVAPKNGKVIVYGTSSTLYRSVNGGQAWTTTDLPTSRMASAFLFSTDNDASMLLGVQAPVKK